MVIKVGVGDVECNRNGGGVEVPVAGLEVVVTLVVVMMYVMMEVVWNWNPMIYVLIGG